jgi:hypothetical protein
MKRNNFTLCHGISVAFVFRMEVRHTPLDVNASLLLCEAGKRFEPENVKDNFS